MIKEVRHDILAEGRYVNQDVQLILDILSAIKRLEEKGKTKQIFYLEMDESKKIFPILKTKNSILKPIIHKRIV